MWSWNVTPALTKQRKYKGEDNYEVKKLNAYAKLIGVYSSFTRYFVLNNSLGEHLNKKKKVKAVNFKQKYFEY